MNTDLIPLEDVLDFFNGKAPTTADDGEYIVFGSNGPNWTIQIIQPRKFDHSRDVLERIVDRLKYALPSFGHQTIR